MTRTPNIFIVLLLSLCAGPCNASMSHSTTKFNKLYGLPGIQEMIAANCSEEYKYYTGEKDWRTYPHIPPYASTCLRCYLSPITSCLLRNPNEADAALMGAAAVTLGLMATVFSLAGATTIETGLLAMRRPMLAFLLSAGSPAVSPLRSFDCRGPEEILRRRRDIMHAPSTTTADRKTLVITLVQYLWALAACANIGQLTYLLCMHVYFAFSPQTDYMPIIYVTMALLIHVAGAVALLLRVRLQPDKLGAQEWTLRGAIKDELTPSASQPKAMLSFRAESPLFLILQWLASCGTIVYIVFGTFLFSSVQFLDLNFALVVCGRFLGSIVACRMVLAYELSGMRKTIEVQDPDRNVAGMYDSEYTPLRTLQTT